MDTRATAVDYDPFAEAAPVARVVPTTEAQREIWLACQLGSEATLAYNESVRLQLRGPVQIAALQAALQDLIDRHDALRATLSADGQRLFIAAQQAVLLQTHDLRNIPQEEQDNKRAQLATEAVRAPFELEQGPLTRVLLLQLGEQHVELLFLAHHIVCDGWSFGVLLRDLGGLYSRRSGLQLSLPSPVSFADFAQALAQRHATAEHRADEAYWLSQYATLPPTLELPCDQVRAAHRRFASERVVHALPSELVTQIRQFGARQGASLFSTLLAAFGVLLQRLGGTDDVVVGVPAAGQTLPGFENTVGHGVNLLPIRLAPSVQAPFAQSLPAVQTAVLDAFEHQHYTFGSLLQKLLIERDPARVPLAPVMFNLDQAFALDTFNGLQAEVDSIARVAENFELFINAVPCEDGSLHLECQYAAALFSRTSVLRWLGSYDTLLHNILQAPDAPLSAQSILTAEDQAQLARFNATDMPLPDDALVHHLLHAQALRTPQSPAVRCEDASQGLHQELSYASLWQQASRVAHALRARGIQQGSRVGLCLPRTADMLPALLGTLMSGACYVPLDPSFPSARLADMAQDAELALLLTHSSVADVLPWPRERSLWLDADAVTFATQPDTPPQADPARDATPQSPAYMIYTSGSTGKPKGVVVPHRAVVNFLLSVAQRPGLQPTDTLLAVTTLSFDIAVLELMLPLAIGARVLMATREQATDGQALLDLLQNQSVSVLQATPSTWRLLLDAGWVGGHRPLTALVGGEALPADLAQHLLQHCAAVWNMYGPTETTVWSACWKAQSGAPIAIGTPLANTQIHVRDPHGQPCPIGVPGELHIGGVGVTLGYWQRPELTADRFIPDAFSPLAGARLYRTGDRGRWRNDGQLEHLGRLDHQVKLRGFRIELGDIETHLSSHPDVAQAVAMVREDIPGDARLVAYVVPRTGYAVPAAAALRDHLKAQLPAYMVPQHFIPLPELPLLANGKIDRKRLPSPQADTAAIDAPRIAPRDEIEQSVMTVMERVLKLPAMSVYDDFFAMGGHSLLAAQLMAQLGKTFNLQLPFRLVFEAPTAERIAQCIRQRLGDSNTRRISIRHDPSSDTAPLTAQQERIAFLEELHPGRVTYNTPSAHRLRGPFNRTALEAALHAVVRRQPALRTVIKQAGDTRLQHILAELEFPIPYEDLSAIPEDEREARLMQRLQDYVDQPIDIHQAPLFRVALFQLQAQEHALLFMPHHIIWDGWSFDLLYAELAAEYATRACGHATVSAPLQATYADYARWQSEWMQSEAFNEQLQTWKAHIVSLPVPKAPSTDMPRTAGMSGEGASSWIRIDKSTTESLRALSNAVNVTMTSLALALYAAMMAQAAGSPTISVGVPVRARTLEEVENIMGFFNNLVPIQLQIDPDESVKSLLLRVKQEFLGALNFQDIPFERLAREPEIMARTKGVGLYQSLFSFQDARVRTRQWGELTQSGILIFQKGATEDLGLWLMEVPHGLEGGMTYNADIYTAATANKLRLRYLELVQRLIANPGQSVRELLDPAASAVASALRHLAAAQPAASVLSSTQGQAKQPRRDFTPTEQLLAEIWSPLLGISAAEIQPQDNYFDLGGDSLSVQQVVAKLYERTGKRANPRLLVFESFEQFARKLDEQTPDAPAIAQKPGLIKRLFGARASGA